jgi:5-methyltetrahydropteroyltriglutamate--homocysteine methyltransferase
MENCMAISRNTTYRAEQVGSLLRPSELLQARSAFVAKRISADELHQAEDQAILGALKLQQELGLDVYTDGEYRRGGWQTDMAESVEGFVRDRVLIDWHGPNQGTELSDAQVVGARLKQHRRLTVHESGFLKQHAPGPFKVTVPAPSVYMLLSYKPGLTNRVYPDRLELLRELTEITRKEIQALIGEGVRYVQLDAPQYTWYVDPHLREQIRQSGLDPETGLKEALAADTACLQGLSRPGLTLGMHLCRGNRRSMWFAEGGYDAIAEQLFNTVPVDRFLLEYDTERSGSFEPLRFVPRGKHAVLGLITTKDPRLENEDDVRQRIDQASRFLPLEQLSLSPQCGFASNAAGNRVSRDDQRKKLELVVRIARQTWGG